MKISKIQPTQIKTDISSSTIQGKTEENKKTKGSSKKLEAALFCLATLAAGAVILAKQRKLSSNQAEKIFKIRDPKRIYSILDPAITNQNFIKRVRVPSATIKHLLNSKYNKDNVISGGHNIKDFLNATINHPKNLEVSLTNITPSLQNNGLYNLTYTVKDNLGNIQTRSKTVFFDGDLPENLKEQLLKTNSSHTEEFVDNLVSMVTSGKKISNETIIEGAKKALKENRSMITVSESEYKALSSRCNTQIRGSYEGIDYEAYGTTDPKTGIFTCDTFYPIIRKTTKKL